MGSTMAAQRRQGEHGGGASEADWAALGARLREEPHLLMQRVADQALQMIAGADGVLVGLLEGDERLRYVCGSGHLGGFVGESMALAGSLSGRAIASGETLITEDCERDERVNRQKTRQMSVRSSVCVPLCRSTDSVGVLNVSSKRPCAFGARDVELLSALAGFMSAVVGALHDFTGPNAENGLAGRFVANVLNPYAGEVETIRDQVERMLDTHAYTIVFQPIFDIADGSLLGAEALARFDCVELPDGSLAAAPPDVWIDRARRVGLGVELELELFRAALESARGILGDALLTLNLGPEALSSPQVSQVLAGSDPRGVVIELTEHVEVADYPQLAESLWTLRERGVRLAIDDTGAGFSSLMHVLKLAPDYIKLDRQLTRGIDGDRVLRALASSLVGFAAETGAVLVAEGVENAAELTALREVGVRYAQGYHLSHPAPLEHLGDAQRRGTDLVKRSAQPLALLAAPVAAVR
jgi:EAL domain-containing protein (putative c-di-GMP-specific phosphodiesterase class I)